MGGRESTTHLGNFLAEFNLDKSVLNEIKEKVCRIVADSYRAEVEEREFVLPDGNVITVGKEALRAPELLFTPFLGLTDMVRRATDKADGNVRESLWDNVVLVSFVC